MGQLATLLHSVNSRLPTSPVLTQMLAIRTDLYPDPVLGRTLQHGCGFMVDGHRHYHPSLGESAFGHSGLGAMTTVFTSLKERITIALHVNGLSGDALTRRTLLADLS